MLVAVMFSRPVNGSRRWFGVAGLGVQPSELAKVACVLFSALMLERRMQRIEDVGYSLTPIALIVGLTAGLILLQPDMGTAVSLLLIVGVMVFLCRAALQVPRRAGRRGASGGVSAPARALPLEACDGVPSTRGTTRSATASS
jgi:cell division protein FtsW (lipid II flippase)